MDDTDISIFGKKKSQGQEPDKALRSDKGTSTRILRSLPHDENYSTRNKKVGIALIFNHELIDGQDPRKGTNLDRDRLKPALELFGFDVRVHNNLKLQKLSATLRDVALEDHSENDCLVIVVMSHGSNGEVYAKDTFYPVDRLWKPFLGNNCKTLINKPKMVFIQSCRGSKVDLPVGYSPMSAGGQGGQTEAVNYFIPTTADLIVFYSSFEGHISFRGPEKGSWFIQSLCECLEMAAANNPDGTELLRLLVRVSRKVAYEYQSIKCKNEELNNAKEMPTIVSTLTKVFYLKVKKDISGHK